MKEASLTGLPQSDTTLVVGQKASVWLCDNGHSEFTGYLRAIGPRTLTAYVSPRKSLSGEPARPALGRRFAAAVCGANFSTILEVTATDVRRATGSTFEYAVTCRFGELDAEQEKLVTHLILEHYAPPVVASL